MAARLASRRGVGYDIDPQYVKIAEGRVQRATAATGDRPSARPPGLVEGARAQARKVLEESGFSVVKSSPKLGTAGIAYDLLIENHHGRRWYVDVAGGDTTVQPGLQRSTVVWETLGKASVLHHADPDGGSPVLVLTPKLPKPRSWARKAIQAVGPRRLFDLIELSDPSHTLRLQLYAEQPTSCPAPGFWTKQQINQAFPAGQQVPPGF